MKSIDVRSQLVHALNLDLVGPDSESPHQDEELSQAPSRWYLTGFLVPIDAGEEQKVDETASDELDSADETGGEEPGARDVSTAHRPRFPSSMGLSVLVPGSVTELEVTVRWGDYRPLEAPSPEALPEGSAGKSVFAPRTPPRWKRSNRSEPVHVRLPEPGTTPKAPTPVPKSNGLELVVTVRPITDAVTSAGLMPKGCRAVSLFLVNRRRPAPDEQSDAAFAFQAGLELRSKDPFVPRPHLRGMMSEADKEEAGAAHRSDDDVADLQYRDTCEYAVGHNVATRAIFCDNSDCHDVHTCWIPEAEVERVAPADLGGVELRMEELADLADAADAEKKLAPLVTQYRKWIADEKVKASSLSGERLKTADALLNRAAAVATRIELGIKLLDNPQCFEAFRLANRVMAIQQRRRRLIDGVPPDKIKPPRWRPFQLAFVLVNLPGIADPAHPDRELVDLLFFPTGGGKTEAYLGLAAFILVLRRLRNPGVASAGVSVLMRYTLRLLTLDQLSRASTLICALELERKKEEDRLGKWPFEIGLWVGGAATPNLMGRSGDGRDDTARARTIAYQSGKSSTPPVPLDGCPWCGTKFAPEDARETFRLIPEPKQPKDLRIVCSNRDCDFCRDNFLPIVTVDEPVYRRLPCFLIATVDKFAAMPWTGEVGGFFGRVERHDKEGFYGPCDPDKGIPLPAGSLLPPDLIIQDELHLISGPLGTMVGLYEAALDELCSRRTANAHIRPKIVASTATVRRAREQIRALFNRCEVDIFPPPGPDRRDSFFARTHSTKESPARLYVAVAAQGRSAKRVMLRTYLTLMAAAQKAYEAAGGATNDRNPADPYMTLLGYFNSLRELGGARRIVEDEVGTQLVGYARRKHDAEEGGLFSNRAIKGEVLELTSRVSTDRVADARRRLALPFREKEHVDVAIATNMISVGLDISRLGLMVVFAQPKTSAEYIQATSRVGRDVQGDDADKPGLVVTVLNPNRSRDRSHYERFVFYHQTFYRSVEATSVTPFSPRALDRGLPGVVVALARHILRTMTPPKGAIEIVRERGKLEQVAEVLAARAAAHAIPTAEPSEELRERVRRRVTFLLDAWERIANGMRESATQLQYQSSEAGGVPPLLREFLHPELKRNTLGADAKLFRANRSMRDVEPTVGLWLRTL